ncbi:MAG: hypothetical protein AB7F43_11140 [Bacteriovoracia bacterium]
MSAAIDYKTSDFHIEQLLKEDGQLIYENLFSTKHLGRVLDFVVFEISSNQSYLNEGELEYRLREVLQLCFFNGWNSYRDGESTKCIQVEVGWDSERIIVYASHLVNMGLKNILGEGESNLQDVSASEFKVREMVQKIQAYSDGIVVRHETHLGKFNLICFLDRQRRESPTAEYIEFQSEKDFSGASQGEATKRKLVPKTLADKDLQGFTEGEKIAIQSSESEKPTLDKGWLRGIMAKITSRKDEGEESQTPEEPSYLSPQLVINEKKEGEGEELAVDQGWLQNIMGRVRKKPESHENKVLDDERILVEGSGETGLEVDNEKISVAGGTEHITDEANLVKGSGEQVQDEELLRIKGTGEQEQDDETLFIKGSRENAQNEDTLVIKGGRQKPQDEQVVLIRGWQEKNEENEVRFSNSMKHYQQDIVEGKVHDSAKAWAESLMQDIVKDRAALNELTKENIKYVKKKELEFDTEIKALKEKLRQKEEELQKSYSSLEHSKKMLSIMSSKIDQNSPDANRVQTSNDPSKQEEMYKKLLKTSKERYERSEERLSDMHRKLNAEIIAKQALQQDLTKQKQHVEVITRRFTELKEQFAKKGAQAQQEAKGQAGAQNQEKKSKFNEGELKHKLDQANRLIALLRDDIAKQKKRFDDLKLNEANLKVEVSKLQRQLKELAKN